MKNPNILISNSNTTTRECLKGVFREHYLICTAKTTQEAWRSIIKTYMDIIILDEAIPELGGLNLLRLLKLAYPQIPVIITSNNPSYDNCLQAFRNGARDYCYIEDYAELSKIVGKIITCLTEKNHHGQNFYLDNDQPLSPEEKKMLAQRPSGNNGYAGFHRVIKYLQENFHEEITKDQLAEVACLSTSHFSRVFKKYTKLSYIEYLTHLRINKAQELLKEQNLPVTEICYSVGYNDLSHFVRTFRKKTGYSPRSYRRQIQKEMNHNQTAETGWQPQSVLNY